MPEKTIRHIKRRESPKEGHRLQLTAVVERSRGGYVATCPQLQGCYTLGRTYEEVMQNIRDAIRLHLEDR
jgi:predicted RNase H-like HicB family nuclease